MRRRSNGDDNRPAAPPSSSSSSPSTSSTNRQNPPGQLTKKSKKKSDSRISTSSSTSSSTGFQSFFRWFKRNEKEEQKQKNKTPESNATESPNKALEQEGSTAVATPVRRLKTGRNDVSSSSSSSCDSVFSTATNGFAFISPVNYNPHGPGDVAEFRINPGPETETYRRRQDQLLSEHQNNILSLKKKYGLYGTSETLQSENTFPIRSPPSHHQPTPSTSAAAATFSDLTLPSVSHYQNAAAIQLRVPIDQRKQSSSHCDLIQNSNSPSLSAANIVHRRTWSACSIKKNKRSAYVRGKRPAPAPPTTTVSPSGSISQVSSLNRPGGSSTYSSLARSTLKKRRAPPPPYCSVSQEVLPAHTQSNRDSGADFLVQEINEGITRNTSNSTPEMDHIRFFVNEQRPLISQQSTDHLEENPPAIRSPNEPRVLGFLAKRNTNNLTVDVSKEEVRSTPRLSPISPRPWYKRPVSGSREPSSIPFKREVILRTVDKRRKKKTVEDEKPSEFSFLRNSRFGLFSRNKEPKKVETAEEVKRRSGIGMPNISELDREAQQILSNQRITLTDEVVLRQEDLISDSSEEEQADDEENFFEARRRRRKSTRELISQFETKSTNQRATTAPVQLDNCHSSNQSNSEPPTQVIKKNSPSVVTSKNTVVPPDVVKLSQNEESAAAAVATKKQNSTDLPVEAPPSSSGAWKCSYCTLQNPNWRILCEVCERIKPYENKTPPGLIPIGIAEPAGKHKEPLKLDYNENLQKKVEKVKQYFPPNSTRNALSKSASETSVSGNLMTCKKFNKSQIGSPNLSEIRSHVHNFANEVVVNSVTVIHDPGPVPVATPVPKERKKMNLNGTPDLEEVRHARLNHFKPQTTTDLTVPVMITDKDSLDRERQRLKEKIRAMNAKALSDRYPVIQKTQSMELTYDTVYPKAVIQEAIAVKRTSPDRSAGAIKKCIKSAEERFLKDPNKSFESKDAIINQTSANLNEVDKARVRELAEQLNSLEGREEFKATLKFSEKTGTMAINKIMRSLESAIMEGEDEVAAKLAKDLAKMKVSLSVTRHRDKEKERQRVDSSKEDLKLIGINLLVEDNRTPSKDPVHIRINPEMTVKDLKEKIKLDLNHPISMQKFIYKDTLLVEDQRKLLDYGMVDNSLPLKLFIVGLLPEDEYSRNRESSPKKMNSKYYLAEADQLESDDENAEEGAMALPEKENPYGEIKGTWTCPLCTLMNSLDKLTCGACSKTKPADFKIPEENKKTPIQLKKFKLPATLGAAAGNNLSRPSSSRQEPGRDMNIRNLVKEERKPSPPPQVKSAARLTEDPGFLTKALGNPNITRNRYRGVDNYNPKHFYKSSSPVRSQIPVKRLSTPKSPKSTDKNPLHLELLKLDDNKDVVENTEPFECPICFGDCLPGNGVVLRDCLHSFCRECLSSTVEHSAEAEIKCPFMDTTYSCESVLQEREIRAVVTEQIYEKHLTKSIRQAENRIENAFHCKTPNCRGWCIYEDNVNIFRCPVCSLTNCLTCQAIHDGLNCKQYQDRMKSDCDTNQDAKRTKEMLEAMVTDGEAMNCPTCQVIVMKKWGCDWLKCTMCKTEICWVTRGPRWGPGGKGDISEGCKCGVFGKKCHTKCTYCH